MPSLISYFNPCSKKFHALDDFKSLKPGQKAKTIILTVVAAIFSLGIAAVPVFRLLVGRFSKVDSKNLSSTDEKTKKAAKPITPPALPPPPPDKTPEELFDEVRAEMKGMDSLDAATAPKIALKLLVEKMDKTLKTATDDGDCFFDAFRQGLNEQTKKKKTVSDLRNDVQEHVDKVYEETLCANAIYDYFLKRESKLNKKPEKLAQKAFTEYKNKIGKCATPTEPPVWGSHDLDGVILSDKYKVNIHMVEIDYNDNEPGEFDLDKLYIATYGYPQRRSYEKTVMVGMRRMHYVPILDK